ncbi:MAG TPA: beta-L-arabinofuranosidase domain-containing protein, partial [Verrucomicrobiae bacterium]
MPEQARPLPLSAVRLTGGPLKQAQALDAAYLLQLDPDRLMYYLRQSAGLPPKATNGYGGWDGGGRQLTGHIAGHYLSAVSYMYAATGDERFKQRADYLVGEMAAVQRARGNGYLGALQAEVRRSGTNILVDGMSRFQDLSAGIIQSGGFDLNGMWSPWYVEHKLFAGLRDAYRLTGNPQALAVEVQFAGWVDAVLRPLTEAQIQKMLNTEFGGMNEVMADLYADTGDPHWRVVYHFFEHHAILDPLARDQDILPGKHGNTQVPKILGALTYYRYTGDAASGEAARYFWREVVDHHSFATGGHGKDEYFGEPDHLNQRVDGRTAETCNVYNMLKLTRELFALQPDIRYADFAERALFNHILASIDPTDGRMCYMVPVGRGVTHEYQDMQQDFTCCVGTGMESHALHGTGIYYESGSKLWVNLYTPSQVNWTAQQAEWTVVTDFPEGETVTLSLQVRSPRDLTLALRRPDWAGEGFLVMVNGQILAGLPGPDHYVEITRHWQTGDQVVLRLPKALHVEPLPDNPRRAALLWGPLVLAGDIGPEDWQGRNRDDLAVVPVLVTGERPINDWLKPVAGQPGVFQSDGVGRNRDITFRPFYRLPGRAYALYWDLYT